MATYVWTGKRNWTYPQVPVNLSGVTGGTAGSPTSLTGGHEYYGEHNFWNITSNWLERVPSGGSGASGGGHAGGSGGASGGSGGQNPGPYYYMNATSYPTEGDDVIFTYLDESPVDGIITTDGKGIPTSECLFGGICAASGATAMYHFWGQNSGGTGSLNSITVESTYFDKARRSHHDGNWFGTRGDLPRNRRFGKDISHHTERISVASQYDGLNLKADTVTIDVISYGSSEGSDETLIQLRGDEMNFGTFYHKGNGVLRLGPFDQINNLILHGTGARYPDGRVKQPTLTNGNIHEWNNLKEYCPKYWVRGKIGNLVRLEGAAMDEFTILPVPGSESAIPKMVIANQYQGPRNGGTGGTPSIVVQGDVTDLQIYPSAEVNEHQAFGVDLNNPDAGGEGQGTDVLLQCFGTSDTLTKVTMHEYNPFHNILFGEQGATTGNLQLDIRNVAGQTTTISELVANAGTFTVSRVQGTCNILEGDLQSQGILDFRTLPSLGSVEVVGHSGGSLQGEGIFMNSVDGQLYPPTGVDVSFRAPSGGATSALGGGLGIFMAKGGKR